jgi:hypothetical protein
MESILTPTIEISSRDDSILRTRIKDGTEMELIDAKSIIRSNNAHPEREIPCIIYIKGMVTITPGVRKFDASQETLKM